MLRRTKLYPLRHNQLQKLGLMNNNHPDVYKVNLIDIKSLLAKHGVLKKEYFTESLSSNLVSFSTDSRKSSENCGFIAYLGVSSDGFDYIVSAVSAHAAFIVCEKEPNFTRLNKVPTFVVTSGRAAWSILSAAACGNPQDKLCMLGVTGTNGKTSTTWMTRQLIQLSSEKTVMVGTIGVWIGDDFYPTKHTTPDPDFFYPILKKAVEDGATTCIMEVSSHAIAQEKLTPVMFDATAFTSFSRDHLDFHKDEEDYWSTKCRLFERMTKSNGPMFFCSGLPRLPEKIRQESALIYGGTKYESNLTAKIARFRIHVEGESFDGSKVTFTTNDATYSGVIPFFGDHAIENFAAALLLSSQVSSKIWNSSLWAKVAQIPGRLEKITGKGGRVAFIDYAHTPDALEKTLTFLQKYRTTQLIVVFGCGGDRDKGKRPIMGHIAKKYADKVYVTSDNPRRENPEDIINDIKRGIDNPNQDQVIFEIDRNLAIKRAVNESQSNAMILIAGKGHETYQIIGDEVLDFDDREVARKYLNS